MKTDNNRRDFLKMASIGGITALTAHASPHLSSPSAPGTGLESISDNSKSVLERLNRFPRIMQEYMVSYLRKKEDQGNELRNGLKTKEDAEKYIENVRNKINTVLGPWPEKTPLNAQTFGKVEREGYLIEKVVFESRPNFLVTANLYLPTNRKQPLPGVLGTCGHSDNGKASAAYQSFCQGLVKKGYVVLIFDPVGQGERLQYVDENLKPFMRIGTEEHNYMGNQLLLNEGSLSHWFVWDGIRALDYLLSRPEVDPNHIGVTGNSGGGTQTALLCGIDPRITMAAPGCYITTWRRNLENEEAADAEQCPPNAVALGLDHSDFLTAMAPNPVIILAQEKDFFDVRGALEAFERLKHLYKLLGAEDQIECHIGSDYHGYSKGNREAMYRWFNRFTRLSTEHLEPALTIETDETLQCTPRGQVKAQGSKTVHQFVHERAVALTEKRQIPTDQALKTMVLNGLKLPPVDDRVPDYRILRSPGDRSYPTKHSAQYAVETEEGVFSLLYLLRNEPHYSRLPNQQNPAILYVAHRSSDEELRTEPLVKELITQHPNTAFYACDVRGIGESEPNTTNRGFDTSYGSDYFYAVHGLMIDYPYVGQRTYDVLRVINLLKSVGHKDIHLVGKGWGAIPATFAALLADGVTQVTLKNAPTSYADIAKSERYNWPLSALIPGVLSHFDLPWCYAALKSKNITQIEPWSALADKQ